MTLTRREAAHADAAFGTGLYRALKPVGNTVFSPASVATALKMALAGARGETADELARVLRLDAPEDAAASLAELGDLQADGELTLRAPNTMWLDETLAVRESYLEALPASAGVDYCDFYRAPETSRQAINAVVREQTAGRITDLISPGSIDPGTRLVLVNAIYLNALWQCPFPADNTKDNPFYPERMEPTLLPTMRLETRMAYHRGGGCQSVLLPYRGGTRASQGTLAMAIVLPDGPLSEFKSGFDLASVLGSLVRGPGDSGPGECLVSLSLPRFRVEASFRLEDVLRTLGVRRAFSRDADFGGICEEPAGISAVVHKAFIDVGEEGTEAAAATAAVFAPAGIIRRPEPDVTLVVDRPFLFAIVDTRIGLPLFLGQFTG